MQEIGKQKYIVCLVLIGCILISGCMQVYYNRDGKVFKYPIEKKDRIIPNDSVDKYAFNVEYFQAGVKNEQHIKYIKPVDIVELLKQNKNLLIIFYYPVCPQTKNQLEIAQYAKSKSLPYLLISTVNEPDKIIEWNKKFELENIYSCILPSNNKDSSGILTKRANLISLLCKTCTKKYRDELIDVDYILFTNYGNQIYLNIEEYTYRYHKVISWIDKIIYGTKK